LYWSLVVSDDSEDFCPIFLASQKEECISWSCSFPSDVLFPQDIFYVSRCTFPSTVISYTCEYVRRWKHGSASFQHFWSFA